MCVCACMCVRVRVRGIIVVAVVREGGVVREGARGHRLEAERGGLEQRAASEPRLDVWRPCDLHLLEDPVRATYRARRAAT